MPTTLTVFITVISSIFFIEFVSVVGKFETSPTTIINDCISYSKPYVEMAGYYAAEGIDILGYYLSVLKDIINDLFHWLSDLFHKIHQLIRDFWQWLTDVFYKLRQLLCDFWQWLKKDIFSELIEWLQNIWENIKQFFFELFNNLFENLIQTFKNFFGSFDRLIALTEDFGKGSYNYLEENYNYFSNVINDKINSISSVNDIIKNSDYFTIGAYAFLLFLILVCSILIVFMFCY